MTIRKPAISVQSTISPRTWGRYLHRGRASTSGPSGPGTTPPTNSVPYFSLYEDLEYAAGLAESVRQPAADSARDQSYRAFVHCQKLTCCWSSKGGSSFCRGRNRMARWPQGVSAYPNPCLSVDGIGTTSPENEMGIFEFPLEGFLVFLVHARNEENDSGGPVSRSMSWRSLAPSRHAGNHVDLSSRRREAPEDDTEWKSGNLAWIKVLGSGSRRSASRHAGDNPQFPRRRPLAASAITVHLDLVPPCGGGAEMRVLPCLRLCFLW
ncbi:hypothetical protein B0J15DRAFT_215998 [Fusarium solani]|uniref:Uncharacterized protein n=1 Tax=Fusarium solani TaxID=169388 RepID=A0A9P9KZS4_FUSSL|nr:uncharacterized protein B0J15DRAFT_215998 [Fusarium solani]KAH7271437.1 hypothetical protein B0J15DRAFT_215998 [Fusarium solani]